MSDGTFPAGLIVGVVLVGIMGPCIPYAQPIKNDFEATIRAAEENRTWDVLSILPAPGWYKAYVVRSRQSDGSVVIEQCMFDTTKLKEIGECETLLNMKGKTVSEDVSPAP